MGAVGRWRIGRSTDHAMTIIELPAGSVLVHGVEMSAPPKAFGRASVTLIAARGIALAEDRQMMPLERTGAFTRACIAILLVVALAIAFLSRGA